MERKSVTLNGVKVYVDAIESIAPTYNLATNCPEYVVTCKSGAKYQITEHAARVYELI